MKTSNLIGRYLRITKLGVFYIWEPRVKAHLREYGLQYTSVVCIQTVNPWYEYIVYIAVRHVPGTGRPTLAKFVKDFKIVKITVKFDESLSKIETTLNILPKNNVKRRYDFLSNIPSSSLIFDARSNINLER